jgi:hypothetical protein
MCLCAQQQLSSLIIWWLGLNTEQFFKWFRWRRKYLPPKTHQPGASGALQKLSKATVGKLGTDAAPAGKAMKAEALWCWCPPYSSLGVSCSSRRMNSIFEPLFFHYTDFLSGGGLLGAHELSAAAGAKAWLLTLFFGFYFYTWSYGERDKVQAINTTAMKGPWMTQSHSNTFIKAYGLYFSM